MLPWTPELMYPAGSIVWAISGATLDVRNRRIPNGLTISGILLGPALHSYLEGWTGLFSSAASALICGAVFALFWLAGGLGGGDVKLIAATAAFAGWTRAPLLLVLTALAGGVLAIVIALARGRGLELLRNSAGLLFYHSSVGLKPHPVHNLENKAALRMPYAVPIAAGALLTFILSEGGH